MKTIFSVAILCFIGTTAQAEALTLKVRAMDLIYSNTCESNKPIAIKTYLQKYPGTPLARAIIQVNKEQIAPIGHSEWCKDMAENY
jgi:hypothetical protein